MMKLHLTASAEPSPHQQIDLSPLSNWQMSLSKHASLDSKQSLDKARGRAAFDNNGKALWGCADRTVSWFTSLV